MKGLLSERRYEQFHEIGSDLPGIARPLKLKESIPFMPRHFQNVFTKWCGGEYALLPLQKPLGAELGGIFQRGRLEDNIDGGNILRKHRARIDGLQPGILRIP